MKPIPLRAQLGLVTASYAVVLATAALFVYERHLQYVNHPEDVAASSGMYAGGDWMPLSSQNSCTPVTDFPLPKCHHDSPIAEANRVPVASDGSHRSLKMDT